MPLGAHSRLLMIRVTIMAPVVTPDGALAELLAGNERFVAGHPTHPNQDAPRRAEVANEQSPFAVVFGCSDSRLAAEIIFDRGLGDLFVVRTAGHTFGAEVLGSIEYAVIVLQVPLVVILGHNSCGAVTAALEHTRTNTMPDGHLPALVDSIRPSVELAGPDAGVDDIVDVHIQHTAGQLIHESAALSDAVADHRCLVVGMSYHLGAGKVRLVTS